VDIKKFHLANTAVIGLISILIVIVTYIDMYKTKARPQWRESNKKTKSGYTNC